MSKPNNKSKKSLILLAVIAVVLLAVIAVAAAGRSVANAPENGDTMPEEAGTEATAQATLPLQVLKDAIRIDKIGSYTGLFVEDGSDEAVSDLLMMVVTNITSDPIQYAQITLDVDGKTAEFSLSVLPAGESAVLIEQNRMKYDASTDYAAANAECIHLAGFEEELSLQEAQLEIQLLDGAINVTNISGKDIDGTILICYKNVANGVFHGGIAYRVKLEGGLKAGEIKQVMGAHFQQPGSEILFVDFAV